MAQTLQVKTEKYENLIQFIRFYRDLPVLWNTKSKDYFDKGKKNEAYQDLTEFYQGIEEGATTEDVKKKINVLRTNFRKELKKKLYLESIGRQFTPTWAFIEFEFLNDYYQQVNKQVTIPTEKEPRYVWELNYGGDVSSTYVENEAIEYSQEVSIEDKLDPELIHIPKRHKPIPKHHEYSQEQENPDVITAKNWVNKLARLKPEQRIWAEKFINDILTEGELGTLHRHFLTISPTEIVEEDE